MIRSCTKSSNEVMSCTIKGKPLVLSWGRTPLLDSGIRWAEVGPSSGKGSLITISCGLGLVQRTSAVLRKRPLEAFRQSCYLRIVASWYGLKFDPLYLRAIDVTRLKFRHPLYHCVLRDLRDAPLPLLEEVHPVLPNQNDTIHERHAGKIGLYTRFFDYANFRLSLSSFLVDILRHFRINISHLSVIDAAKVSHFEILCHVYEIVPNVGLFRCFYINSKKNGWISFSKHSENAPVCYTKPLDSLKNWNGHFFWVDSFACPALFPWHIGKNVTRDPVPVATDFNAQDYTTLVAYLSPFRKFLKEFPCLVGLSRRYTLDEETYPRFLHKNEKDMDLFAFIHAPDLTKVKIVERERVGDEPLFLQTTVGRTIPLLPVAPDRADSELETSIDKLFDEGGSGSQAVQGGSTGVGEGTNIQPVTDVTDIVTEDVAPLQPRRQRKRKAVVDEAGGSLHSPKTLREDHETPSGPPIAGKFRSAIKRLLAEAVLNVEVMGDTIPTLPFVTSFVSATPEHEDIDHTDSVTGLNLRTISAPSSVLVMTAVTTTTPTAYLAVVVKEKTAKPFIFAANSSFAGEADPNAGVFSDLTESDFLVNGVRTEHDQLFTEFNVRAARQMSLSAEVRMRAKYKIREKRTLKSAVDEKDELLKSRDKEIKNLKAHMVLKEAEVAKAIRLRAEASNFVTVEKSLRDEVADLEASAVSKERELTHLHAQLTVKSHNDSLADQVHEVEVASSVLQEKFSKMALHLEERFYPHLLTTIFGSRWLLTHDMELAISKCLNSSEYLFALGTAIGKAIEKVMQDGLSARITHGMEGRALTDVAAYNPFAKADYISALQQETLAERLGLTELQPHVDQLMVPVHHSPDKTVVGATSLSSALDVSNVRVRKIRENIAGQRSALRDVFIPLTERFYAEALTGAGVALIFVDDYVVVGTDDQASAAGNADPFPNVDDVELNIL
nr:hypothetical protein [Tanacetum cinerariifolium]